MKWYQLCCLFFFILFIWPACLTFCIPSAWQVQKAYVLFLKYLFLQFIASWKWLSVHIQSDDGNFYYADSQCESFAFKSANLLLGRSESCTYLLTYISELHESFAAWISAAEQPVFALWCSVPLHFHWVHFDHRLIWSYQPTLIPFSFSVNHSMLKDYSISLLQHTKIIITTL